MHMLIYTATSNPVLMQGHHTACLHDTYTHARTHMPPPLPTPNINTHAQHAQPCLCTAPLACCPYQALAPLQEDFEGLLPEEDWVVPGGYNDSLSTNTQLGRAVHDACLELDALGKLVGGPHWSLVLPLCA